ncbi:hypothetical protein F7725_006789 [Dissostichus mawsoni]|uniref:Neurobeachin a n=1 Tax=Dissostichus mawsoni TaxID=36200 RepID=A0A7J5XWI1_DISMA|nr:hypothetical protein F7725_006789 [Dissostichus mawsoni]
MICVIKLNLQPDSHPVSVLCSRCLLQCSVWQDWMFSLGYINPKSPEEQKITEMVYNIFRILLYHAIKYEWGGWRVWVDTLSIAHSKVTYEAHKEYLAKMYEEYQRQEEENMKKGKKGCVSTISGLSATAAPVVNGNLEIDDNSQTQTPESEAEYSEGAGADSRILLAEGAVKRPNGEALTPGEQAAGPGVRVEVHDLLVDIKAEKVEATEVKLDDLDLSPEGLSGGVGGGNGPLVEVDSLLDSAYCAVVQNLNGSLAPKDDTPGSGVGMGSSLGLSGVSLEDDGNMGPLITLADEKDSVPSNNGFLFSKVDEKLLPALAATDLVLPSPDQPTSSASDDLSLLAHMTTCGSDLTQSQSHTSGDLPEDGPFKIQSPLADISSIAQAESQALIQAASRADFPEGEGPSGAEGEAAGLKAGDSASTTSDTERSDDGKDKDTKKIQTTATTQALHGRTAAQLERDLRVDLGFRGMPMTEEQRRQFSPGPRTTMFRIPEFKWSPMHQSHSTKSVMDFVNSNENIIFVHNTIHLISQMVDNIIIACGGILPLLSAATSPSSSKSSANPKAGGAGPQRGSKGEEVTPVPGGGGAGGETELENIEATQGMSSETAVTFLSRLMAMVDVLVFASSLNFSEIEAEKNMSSGGLMRQCLRLVCCVAVRNCLECRQRQRDRSCKSSLTSSKSQDSLHSASTNSKQDPDRLLQDVDINRLRAVVFRDVDDSKQAQFLALAVVYFISVLMVSKYRDILEPQREIGRSTSLSGRSIRHEINSPTSTEHPSTGFSDKQTPTPVDDSPRAGLPHTDSGIGEEGHVAGSLNGSEMGLGLGLGLVGRETDRDRDRERDMGGGGTDLLCSLSDVRRSQESLLDSPHNPNVSQAPPSSISSISQTNKGINVKEILKSLVAAPVDGGDLGQDSGPTPYHPDPALKTHPMLPMQFHSFDRSVMVPVKKPPPGSLSVNTVGTPTTSGSAAAGSTPNIFAAATATPKSMINTTGATDSASSSSSSSSSFVNGATSKNLPAVQTVAPMPEDSMENMSAYCEVAQCALRSGQTPPELKSFSSLAGFQAAPRDAGHITTKLERALEKVAPLLREIFVDFAPFLSRTLLGSHGQELLIEGLVCMKSSTSVVELVMLLCSQEWQNSIQKNAGLAFIELINEGSTLRTEREEEKMCDHLISAAKHRDHVTANQLKQKILNILTNKHGAWGTMSQSQLHDFWRLDYWEDDLRRRRRFVRNASGSTHADVSLKALEEYGTEEEEEELKSKKTFRSQSVVAQNPEAELMLEGDDDAVSLLQEKEIDNLAGPVVLSTPAQLVAPVVVARGTLSITTTEIYFEVDEEDPTFKSTDAKDVQPQQVLAYSEGLHGKWMFSEIRAVFSRRYLLQNTGLEVFMANRTSVMFNFPDPATVKRVVYSLPRLFKSSNMTQRWQRREISNFEYLMFLNTIAGRTYNDLNQYPIFPWVLTNYDSEELDLTLPGNFRDLSKPIGALNPKRAAFYAERFETWDDDSTPPHHYTTMYSTAHSTLMWMLRIEPFTTFFLNANDNKFDHPERAFSGIGCSWRNCQRDTADVKELIPEFYYLPEMFVNSNEYELGVREDGISVCDVELPAWAKKPRTLSALTALESEFVSCQLHQWIDLIFGYKQRGPEAVRSLNVFNFLSYEGSINLENADAVQLPDPGVWADPLPLLIEPHPPRSSAMHLCFLPQSPLMFKDQMQQDVIMVLKFPSNSPVTHVAANTLPHLSIPAAVTVTCSRLFAVNRWHNTVGLRGAPGYSLEQAHHLPIEMDPLIANNSGVNKRQITDLVDQSIQINTHCFVVTADNRYILVCGFWDKSFRVYSTETDQSPTSEVTATSCRAPETPLFFCGTGVDDITLSGTTLTTVSDDLMETMCWTLGVYMLLVQSAVQVPEMYVVSNSVFFSR